jgi:DNA primase
MKEQTLIAEMNKYIRSLTPSPSPSGEGSGQTQGQNEGQTQGQGLSTPLPLQGGAGGESSSAIEELLIREIIRHGEEIIFKDVETEEGQNISLSVSQYIDFDLAQDGLEMVSPLHRQILSEAVAHQGEQGFKAETYFCSHPDMQVSQLATRLAIDRHQLGGRFEMDREESDEEKKHQNFVHRLQQRVLHLVMDYRLDIIETKLKEIQRELLQVGGDRERMMELLKEHKETKEIRDALAKRLGTDLVV